MPESSLTLAPYPPPLGVVLAGGCGSRLGGGKPAAALAGRPLISYPRDALVAAGIEAAVWAKPGQELPDLGVAVHREPATPRHPLCGIVAALRDSFPRPLIVLACDLPFVAPELLVALAEMSAPLVVPVLAGVPQPLLARYDSNLLPDLEAALGREEPLGLTVRSLNPRPLDGACLSRFGDPERLLFNVNDSADLARAEQLFEVHNA